MATNQTTALGDVFFGKAAQYEDASVESMAYMDVCGACDLYNGNVQAVIEHIETHQLRRWREVASNPARSQTIRDYWQRKVAFMEDALQELVAMTQDKE